MKRYCAAIGCGAAAGLLLLAAIAYLAEQTDANLLGI